MRGMEIGGGVGGVASELYIMEFKKIIYQSCILQLMKIETISFK